MPDKITTLKLVDNTGVFPNIKDENIPNTIMRIADLSKYLNQLKSININGDIYSTTTTSDIATFTTADISTLNVSGVSQFEGEATFGNNVHVDGNLVVNGIDNIVDKDGNKIVKNETLDNFTREFYDNCDVGLYMSRTIGAPSFIMGDSSVIRIPYLDKVTNLSCLCGYTKSLVIYDDSRFKITVPDIPNPVTANSMFTGADCESIIFNNVTLVSPDFAFCRLKGVTSVVVADGKTAKIVGSCIDGFSRNGSLTEIGSFDLSAVTSTADMFVWDPALKSIHCTHFRLSFDISSSTAFEQADLVEIISNLDTVSTAQTLAMGSTNLAKLTQEQILVATGKGWTLA